MAKAPTTPTATKPAAASGLFGRLREWTAASKVRALAIAGSIALAVALTIGGWLYAVRVTVLHNGPTAAQTLAALDAGDFEHAEKLARALQQHPAAEEEWPGVALYVLGSARANQAGQQWSDERRGVDHLVASKYLLRALEVGVPEDRHNQAQLMAGRSLLHARRPAQAIKVLNEALEVTTPHEIEIHALLAEAYAMLTTPDLPKSLVHNGLVLASLQPNSDDYNKTALARASMLGRLNRLDEARQLLASLPATMSTRLVTAWIDLRAGENQMAQATLEADSAKLAAGRSQLTGLAESLQDIKLTDDSGQEAVLLRAQALAASGDTDRALAELVAMRQIYSSGPLATYASLIEGDVHRTRDDFDKALVAYRRAIGTLGEPRLFHSDLLSMDQVRMRLGNAVEEFRGRDQFAAALELNEELRPIVGPTLQTQLRAGTLAAWGDWLMTRAADGSQRDGGMARQGRQRLREAGIAYQALSQRRFATEHYIDDLWDSCECLFRGQGYTAVVQTLNDYLKYEPEKRNAQALLRLGQSRLALGQVHQGIDALEECMELHPDDAATFQARLDCARGCRDLGDVARAEQLLLNNLTGSLLSPRSPEWRDSLFELGHLLHDAGRYPEAIDRLEEAIDRYPEHPQTRLALYMVGDAYRQAAIKPLEDYRNAKTENERESAHSEIQRLLNEAIARYELVQRSIALSTAPDPLDRAMLRNCYMLRGEALFDLGRYDDAIKAYSNVSTLYQREPFVLETLVQIAHCQRRLNEPLKARLTIEQALQAIDRIPEAVDFQLTTNFSRTEWRLLLTDMSKW